MNASLVLLLFGVGVFLVGLISIFCRRKRGAIAPPPPVPGELFGAMKIFITCTREDPNSDEHDVLQPYLAEANWRGIQARDSDPKRAMATVKGIILHALGEFPDPPDQIRFSCIDLSRQMSLP